MQFDNDGQFRSDFPAEVREDLWRHASRLVLDHLSDVNQRPVTPLAGPEEIRAHLSKYTFDTAVPAESVISDSVDMIQRWTLHTMHKGYLGLFNPNPTFMSVVGDMIASAMNPQLAAWSHAPGPVEVEAHVLRFLGAALGFPQNEVHGSFTSGGAEANHSGVLLALTRKFPEFGELGLRALPGQPTFYASSESHLAWLKISHACGLGREAVRLVPSGDDLRLDVTELERMIHRDRNAGKVPFLVVGTAGTTSAGVIDPLEELADLAWNESVNFHVDAAWGGGAALSNRLRPALQGIERADSVTLDAHKWLSVPLGAGTFLCRDLQGLQETFRVTTSYMPGSVDDAIDPYTSSNQWSRRFMGLKLFMSLASTGREGYGRIIDHQAELGEILEAALRDLGWEILNDTPLPVVCFAEKQDPDAANSADRDERISAIADRVTRAGKFWISTVRLRGRLALRACITNYDTSVQDLKSLVAHLDEAASALGGRNSE